jgi:uncharacterized protein YqgV (UPF0045/DUF77 family)
MNTLLEYSCDSIMRVIKNLNELAMEGDDVDLG